MNCICIDDELPALKLMELYCLKNTNLNLLGVFNDPLKALEFIEHHSVDLAIMDIQMPELNGIDFFKKINHKVIGIFISSNPVFALDAYNIDIIDFILKPASYERFEKAIAKAHTFKSTMNQHEEIDIITIKEDYFSKNIRVNDIEYIQSSGEYLKIITKEKTYTIFQRLKEFEENYQHFGFLRIHKSYLIVKDKIAQANFNSVKLKNGVELPVGRVYKDNLK